MKLFYFLLAVFSAITDCGAQGTFQVTFDWLPYQPPGTGRIVESYTEADMVFTAPGGYGFGRVGVPTNPGLPDNGTAYIQADSISSLAFNFIDGSPFNLVSVDLAEYSTVVPNARTVQFVGYREDGSTISTSFATDGIIDGTGPLADFQTFNFNANDWTGLTRVEVPTVLWSMDNLVVSVPEPSTAVLFLGAVGVLAICRRRLKSKRVPAIVDASSRSSTPD